MPAAVAVPAIISGAGALYGGIKGASASKAAAATQAHWGQSVGDAINTATGNAQAAINRASDQAQAGMNTAVQGANRYLDPYTTLGNTAAANMNAALQEGGALSKQFSFNPSDLENDPGYQFQMQQGMKALERMGAATGMNGSGGMLKAGMNFNQGLASTSFQNAYDRALSTFQTNRNNALSSLQTALGFGMPAAQQAGGNLMSGAQYTGNTNMNAQQIAGEQGIRGTIAAGDAYLGGADAKAAGQVASGNAWSNMGNQLANIGGQVFAKSPMGSSSPSISAGFNLPTDSSGNRRLGSIQTGMGASLWNPPGESRGISIYDLPTLNRGSQYTPSSYYQGPF
jgi:hypothetical protein